MGGECDDRVIDTTAHRASGGARLAASDDGVLHRLRLDIDHQSVEFGLLRHGIEETIVVLGSAEIPEPDDALRRLAALQALAADHPAQDLRAAILEAGKDVANARYYDEARALGRVVSCVGRTKGAGKLVIMTGGGAGIMEAAHRGAHDVGALSVGVTIDLPNQERPNRYVSPGLVFSVRTSAARKLHFRNRSKALVAFPGGFGTLDEVFETLRLVETGRIDPMPIVLVGTRCWEQAIDFEFLVGERMISGSEREFVLHADTAQEAWDAIIGWYAATGRPFLSGREPICPAARTVARRFGN